jgi:hypothetical protein
MAEAYALTENGTMERLTLCCGDPKNLDGNAHPWVHVSEDGPGDVYTCPVCKAVDID